MPWTRDLCVGQPLASRSTCPLKAHLPQRGSWVVSPSLTQYLVGVGWGLYLSSLHFYTCDTCASDNAELGSPGLQQKGGGCKAAVYHTRTQAHTVFFHCLLWDNVHESYLGSPVLPVAWVMPTLQQYASKSSNPGVLSVKGTGALSPSLVLPMKPSSAEHR